MQHAHRSLSSGCSDDSGLHERMRRGRSGTRKCVTVVQEGACRGAWKFQDICYAANFPVVEDDFLDRMLADLMPCVIITPLDCFWEGSLLLGPDYPVSTGGIPEHLTWANLNPRGIVKSLLSDESKETVVNLGLLLSDIMNMSGVGTAYQEKPCLNPQDEDCPDTAPNKNSSQPLDLGEVLTGGCHGFSSKFMHWKEELIYGGVMKNRAGYISRVEAYQTVLQLMGEKELYDYYVDQKRVSGTTWTLDAARTVLHTWQRKFSAVINGLDNSTSRDRVYAFSYTSLMDIMRDFSSISVTRIVIGFVLMFIYACVSLMRWSDAVNSQSGIGMAGVALVSLAVAAGLGMCSVLGITFNASTTQIIPFLALGLGVDDMFLLAHTYAECSKNVPYQELTGEVLKRTGVTVLLTSVTNMLAFFSAAIIPIPALRAFSLQAGILVLFNIGAVLVVFPAIVSLDLARREDNRIDVLCCFQSAEPANQVLELHPTSREAIIESQHEHSPPPSYSPPPAYTSVPLHHAVTHTAPDGSGAVTSLAPGEAVFVRRNRDVSSGCPSTTSSQQCLTSEDTVTCSDHCKHAHKECRSMTLTCLSIRLYTFLLDHTFVKVTVVVAFLVLLVVGVWGLAQVKDGLDLTDVVPRDTTEYNFLEAQAKYFGFYSVYAITQGDMDYPNSQRLLYDYNTALQRAVNLEYGKAPPFWLQIFRDWLQNLQNAFDRDVAARAITVKTWYHNASDDGIFAYKLLAQTGDPDQPLDRNQVLKVRLVSADGIINPSAFYNYLSAWRANDAMAYAASMGNLHPLPKDWTHNPRDFDFDIPRSQPLVYAQIPFYLTNLSTTEEILNTVKAFRSVCDQFTERGLPNYPSGVPFTFWEQYIHLRFYLLLALLCVLGTTFVVLTIVLMNPWLATVLVRHDLMTSVYRRLLPVCLVTPERASGGAGDDPGGAVRLHGAVRHQAQRRARGYPRHDSRHRRGVHTACVCGIRDGHWLAEPSSDDGDRAHLRPVVHGALSTFLGIVMLASTEFDFIVKYFFHVLTALVFLGMINGLILLPVLLSFLGPRGEVRPKDNPDRLSTPTPEPSPRLRERVHRSRRVYPRMNSDTFPSTHFQVASASGLPPTQVTRVKATATVKVEVHTPIPGAVNQEHSYKSKRRKMRQLREQDSTASDSEYVVNGAPVSSLLFVGPWKAMICSQLVDKECKAMPVSTSCGIGGAAPRLCTKSEVQTDFPKVPFVDNLRASAFTESCFTLCK
ncbi:hypothetical protein C0Q70_15950 [Pomacea canaliculata]|uniref:SSD domain-containing protein n=1 Tax=Pomacea canaliculata TaxID=400727 RepID=A0A2T7NNF6_POMCA|nr:hypothetical protein C0Q70_15950 [Pomacea canaliculata]